MQKIVAVLHDVRSLHNVGSIFRTADAAGVSKIYCCGITPGPFDRLKNLRPDFAKVALGAQEYIEWESAKNIHAVIQKLKEDGFTIFALEQSKDSVPYYQAPRAEKIAIIVGHEVVGLPTVLTQSADAILEIPMLGKKESLNVAVAFGVLVFGLRFPPR